MLSDGRCTAHEKALAILHRNLPPPPLGACMIPIVQNYLDAILCGTSVLEVGCGSWELVKKHCESVGANYEAIDTITEYFGRKTIATRIENLAHLSFQDDQFDVVMGTQSMEHWAEYGCSLRWGLYQCFRVCKPGGQVFMNVPVHFHGTKTFMMGDIDRIESLFGEFSDQVRLESWGRQSKPLAEYYPYPGFAPLVDKPAYVLDIRATKDRPLRKDRYSNRGAATGRLAEILNYPLTYNFYRVLRKLPMLVPGAGA